MNAKKAEAELAYELQAAKEKQGIRQEQIEIEVIQRRKMIEVIPFLMPILSYLFLDPI